MIGIVSLISALASAAEPIPTADWTVVSGQWTLEQGVFHGIGEHPDGWAYLESTRPLAPNYAVRAHLGATDGFAELVLEKCPDRYLRVYVYTVEHNLHVGNGLVSNGVPDGGPTIENVSHETVKDGSEHDLVVQRAGKRLIVTLDGTQLFDKKVKPTGCSAYGLLTGSDATFSAIATAPNGS